MSKQHRIFLIAFPFLLALVACGDVGEGYQPPPDPDTPPTDPVAGQWESADPVGASFNRMLINEDLTGDALLYFYLPDDPNIHYLNFYLLELAHTPGVEYVWHLECDGDCDEADFQMTCQMRADQTTMGCSADGVWSDYGFLWEKL